MLNDPHVINVKDSLILFIGFKKLYVFSRNTGKFLYEISSYGRGPDEYSFTTSIYDEAEDLFFVNMGKRNGNYINVGYNFKGEVVKTICRPGLHNSDDTQLPIGRFWPLNDSLYLGYVDNFMVHVPEKIILFDNNGIFLRSYPNYNTIDKNESGSFSFSAHKSMFFNNGDTVRTTRLFIYSLFTLFVLACSCRSGNEENIIAQSDFQEENFDFSMLSPDIKHSAIDDSVPIREIFDIKGAGKYLLS